MCDQTEKLYAIVHALKTREKDRIQNRFNRKDVRDISCDGDGINYKVHHDYNTEFIHLEQSWYSKPVHIA